MTIPTTTVNKEATIMITLKNSYNDFVINESERLTVNVTFDKTMEHLSVKPIKEIGDGRYKTSFTVSRYGYYQISVIVDGLHISGSPYR